MQNTHLNLSKFQEKLNQMNFFLGGDFKIQQSWDKRQIESRNSKSRDKQKSKTSLKNNNSALMNAGKNMFEPVYEPKTDLLDDDVTKKILKDFAAEIPPLPTSAKSQKKISMNDNEGSKKNIGLPPKVQKGPMSAGDQSLIASMAARLKQVELTSKSQREEIKQKTQIIQKLKTQNEFLRGLRNDSSKVLKDMQDLRSQNEVLQKKIKQMQDYLKKYGVKWVGYNIEGKFDHESLKNDIKKPKFNYRMPAEIQLGTIQRRVEQLNAGLHSEGMGTEVYSQNGVHKFRKAEPLPMAFFGNGIAIKGFKFFPYKSKQSLQILSDLVDGYFPYVLKHKFPNGVFLSVIDKIALKYDENMMDKQGQQNVVNFEQMGVKDFLPPSKEQFLSKLPKQVIKNGKVIEIRKAIEKKLNGEPDTIVEQDEDFHTECQTTQDGTMIFLSTCYKKVKSNEVTEEQICTLKIRTDNGKVCVLHVEKSVQINKVYGYMDKVVGEKKTYKLMGNYPRRIYEKNQKETLEQLGLFPNAMLHVHFEGKK